MSAPLHTLGGIVSARVLLDAVNASQLLTRLGVTHALIGGLAVGLYGYPRATKDVDFLVGAEAFERMEPFLVYREELKDLVRVGVVDLMAVPLAHPALRAHLKVPTSQEIPVIPLEVLFLMKLDAHRPQDQRDILALLAAGVDLVSVRKYLLTEAPGLVNRLAKLMGEI